MSLKSLGLILTIFTLNSLIYPAHAQRNLRLLRMDTDLPEVIIKVNPTITNHELARQLANMYGLDITDVRLTANGKVIDIDSLDPLDRHITTINVANSFYTPEDVIWNRRSPWFEALHGASRFMQAQAQKELDMHEVIRYLDPVAGELFIEEVTTLPSQEDRLKELSRREKELMDERADYSY